MSRHKKAQIGETINWVVATIIVILVLLFFIYISIALGKSKALKAEPNLNNGKEIDWINIKTEIAYSMNSNNKDKIDIWISQENFNEENE